MRKIGTSVSESELQVKLQEGKIAGGIVIDFKGMRFIKKDEFYTPEGPTTLDWENLGEILRLTRSNYATIPNCGDFEDLLYQLINPLEEKGEFSSEMKKDFLCFLHCNYGEGITVYTGRGSDPHGRTTFESGSYYPKRIEDAQGYLRDTLKTRGMTAKIGEWIFPREDK